MSVDLGLSTQWVPRNLCSLVQVTLVSLASLNCSPLLLETSPVGADDDDSGVPLEIPSAAPELFGLLDCGKASPELLDSVADSLMLMGCVSSSLQLAQKKLATIKRDLLMKNLRFMNFKAYAGVLVVSAGVPVESFGVSVLSAGVFVLSAGTSAALQFSMALSTSLRMESSFAW